MPVKERVFMCVYVYVDIKGAYSFDRNVTLFNFLLTRRCVSLPRLQVG